MRSRWLQGALGAVLLFSTYAAGFDPQAVTQLCTKSASVLQQCSSTLPDLALQNICCSTMRIMQDLGCFCMESTKQSARSVVSPDAWAGLNLCQLGADADLNSRCVPQKQESKAVLVPDILSELGILELPSGQQEAGSQALQSSQYQDLILGTQFQASSSFNPRSMANENTRPVLDLSTVADDDTTLIFATNSDAGDVTVTMSEDKSQNGDFSMTFDVDFPKKLLANGIEFSLEVTDSELVKVWDELVFSVDVDVPEDAEIVVDMDVNTDLPRNVAMSWSSRDMGRKGGSAGYQILGMTGDLDLDRDELEWGMEVSDDELVSQLTNPAEFSKDFTLELDIDIPQSLLSERSSSVDVELEVDDSNTARDTAITVDSNIIDIPVTSQVLGELLNEATEWLSSLLPMPVAGDSSQVTYDRIDRSDQLTGLLGGAIEIINDMGDEITVSLSENQLRPGDMTELTYEQSGEPIMEATVTIEDQLGEDLYEGVPIVGQESLTSRARRRSLDALTEAVHSAMFSSQAEHETYRQEVCSVCAWVHAHLRLLWGVVYANVALLSICIVAAAVRTFRRSSQSPTNPDSDLGRPLIVSAADFAQADLIGAKQTLSPFWEPAQKL